MLPFNADVLTALYEQANRAIWPGQIVALALALGTLVLASRRMDGAVRWIGLALAAGWAWTGAVFHLQFFAPLNFAAPIYGWFFIAQSLLLLWSMVVRGRLTFDFEADVFGWAGLALALLALLAFPLGDGLLGNGWTAVQLVGLAPDPTAVFTLGVLLLVRGRPPLHLAALPFLWCLVAVATAWVLDTPQTMILPVAGLIGFVLTVWKNRRARV